MGLAEPTNITKKDGQPPAKRRCRREGAKWTRSGCLTCKRRRKRCDEAKPSCNTCIRLGLACEGYGSMWAAPLDPSAHVFTVTESSKRRKLSLSPAPSSISTPTSLSDGQTPSNSSTISTPPACQNGIQTPESSSQALISTNDNQLIHYLTPQKHISHLSILDTHYLQYHMEMGSKLLANLETNDNPLRSLIIPRALSSPLLMKALCALSAIHFSNRAPYSWSEESQGASYYIETMRGLRTTLSLTKSQSQAGAIPEDALLAVALLCKYEIVRGSVKQWAVHLDALQTLVQSNGGFSQVDVDTAEFIRGLFVYVNNVASFTSRKTNRPCIADFDTMKTRKLDIYIGYTEEILKTCARISDLSQLSSDPEASTAEIKTIDNRLHTWTSSETTYIIPKGMGDATLSRLRTVAECFRDAAYIYLHSTLERISAPSFSPSNPNSDLPLEWSSEISLTKSTAIRSLLDRLKPQQISNNCEFSALTFPLFIAGCETGPVDQEDRQFILSTLTALEVSFGIGNVKRAKEVLGVVWAENVSGGGKGRHWVDVLEGLGWDLNLG